MRAPQTPFEKQVVQIACLGAWQIVTGGKMTARLEPVEDPRWEQKTGLFVTLKIGGTVRGSMGLLESTTTLAESLFDAGQTAATHDERFPPIENKEVSDLEITVTLLSEIKKLKDPKDLEIGKMGLIISRGEKQGVLLSHVAVENKWNAEQFLEATCEKAELNHKAWKDPNTLVEYFKSDAFDGGNLIKNIQGYI
jgi:AmmeMemoRadiSam system protein A